MIISIRIPVDLFELHKACISGKNLKQVMSRFIFLVVLLTSVNVLAATPVTPVDETMQVNDKGCNVTVYQSSFFALKNGEIEEICFIEGTLSGVTKNSAEKVVKNNVHAACKCGTDNVYLMSRSEPDGTSAHVVMVAFRYVNEQVTSLQAVDPDQTVKQRKSTYRESIDSRQANTRRVFTDDYERVLATVTKHQQRGVVWLGLKNKAD